MSTSKTVIATAVVAAIIGALGTGFAIRRHLFGAAATIHRLEIENDQLRDRLTAAMLANPGAAALRPTASTTATGRDGRLSAMTSQVKLREASRDALPTAPAHPLKFRGYDTPLNAVESFCWACYHSDAEMVARSLYLDDDARAAVDKIRTSLSPEMQALYPTAESLLGMCIAYDVISSPGPNSEDFFIDAPKPNYIDSDNFKAPGGHQYHLTADGWKYSIPARVLPGFVNGVLNRNAK